MIRKVASKKPGQYDRSHHPWRLSGKWRKATTISQASTFAVLSEPLTDAKCDSSHINEGVVLGVTLK